MSTDKPARTGIKFASEFIDELPEYMGPSRGRRSAFAQPIKLAVENLGIMDGRKDSPWIRFLFETMDERKQFQGAVSHHAKAIGSEAEGWKFQTRTDKKDPCIMYVRKIAVKPKEESI
jgi:hypothetical protein